MAVQAHHVSSDRVIPGNNKKNRQVKGSTDKRPVAARATGILCAQRSPTVRDMTSGCFTPPPIRPPIDLSDQSDTVKVRCPLGPPFSDLSVRFDSPCRITVIPGLV